MRNIIKGLLGAHLHLGIAPDAIALLYRGPGPRAPSSLIADTRITEDVAQSPQRLLALCRPLLAQKGYAQLPLHVTVDDSWAHLFLVTPPQNAGRLQDLQAAAAMRFHALFGESPGEWQIEADWQASDTFFACALPRAFLTALQQLATESNLVLQSVQPNIVAAWNRHHRAVAGDGWFGVVHEQNLTLVALAPQTRWKIRRLQGLRTLTIPTNGHALPWLLDCVTRFALQSDLALPSKLYMTGNSHQYWTGSAMDGALTLHNLDGATAVAANRPSMALAMIKGAGSR